MASIAKYEDRLGEMERVLQSMCDESNTVWEFLGRIHASPLFGKGGYGRDIMKDFIGDRYGDGTRANMQFALQRLANYATNMPEMSSSGARVFEYRGQLIGKEGWNFNCNETWFTFLGIFFFEEAQPAEDVKQIAPVYRVDMENPKEFFEQFMQRSTGDIFGDMTIVYDVLMSKPFNQSRLSKRIKIDKFLREISHRPKICAASARELLDDFCELKMCSTGKKIYHLRDIPLPHLDFRRIAAYYFVAYLVLYRRQFDECQTECAAIEESSKHSNDTKPAPADIYPCEIYPACGLPADEERYTYGFLRFKVEFFKICKFIRDGKKRAVLVWILYESMQDLCDVILSTPRNKSGFREIGMQIYYMLTELRMSIYDDTTEKTSELMHSMTCEIDLLHTTISPHPDTEAKMLLDIGLDIGRLGGNVSNWSNVSDWSNVSNWSYVSDDGDLYEAETPA